MRIAKEVLLIVHRVDQEGPSAAGTGVRVGSAISEDEKVRGQNGSGMKEGEEGGGGEGKTLFCVGFVLLSG